MHPPISQAAKRTSLPLLALFCLLPALQTAVSIHFQWYTNLTYPVFKLLMIAVPIVVWRASRCSLAEIRRLAGCLPTTMLAGLSLGLLMAGVILTGYYLFLQRHVNPLPVLDKVHSLGLFGYYWLMAVFISLAHSLLEEYYWRAFILTQLARWIPGTLALSVSAGAIFGLHHIFVLLSLFGLPLLALCVLATMLAGFAWSWMRLAGYSIWDCYISHVFADLAVMWIGYDLILRAK